VERYIILHIDRNQQHWDSGASNHLIHNAAVNPAGQTCRLEGGQDDEIRGGRLGFVYYLLAGLTCPHFGMRFYSFTLQLSR
jgi:hypothetical protein